MMTSSKSHEEAQTSSELSSKVLISSIEKTEELINPSVLKQAVSLLAKARRIHIFGLGHSGESSRNLA